MGGKIQYPYVMRGTAGLMPTRTIGDEYFKPVGIVATPSIGEYEIKSDDLVLIAACDGLYDFMNNNEISELVRNKKPINNILFELKKEVLIKRCGTDNLTIIAVKLN